MDKYKHFFYKNLDLACFANLDGYFEEISENFTKALGYTSEDLCDKKFFDFIHPDDVASTLKEMEHLGEGRQTVNFINRFKTKTGSYRYLEWNSVFDAEINKICAVARDVTGRVIANRELFFQIQEKEILASELQSVNHELDLQNDLKEKRTGELLVAHTALVIQNAENKQRSEELTIANLQLAFEIEEKKNRATELGLANEELVFQNEEKEKRAAELIVANIELAFQNDEKEKRAAELIMANQELVLQNEEKEKRANELVDARSSLKKTESHLREHIVGLEKMLVMTSHGVRQPVASILGIIHLLDRTICSPDEQKKLTDYIKQSALALDLFVKKLTIYMYNLGKDASDQVHPLY